MAQASILNHGQKGISDGLETDSNGLIYAGNLGDNSIEIFDPANGTISILSRDPRFVWIDTFAVATGGYIYFTVNQLWRSPSYYPGVDRWVKSFALFQAKLPDNATKANLQ